MFCTNCGEPMRDSDKFCAECGTPAAPRPAKSRAASAPAPDAPAPVRPAQSTAEAFRAPLSATAASASNPSQTELGFAASPRPTTPPPMPSVAPRQQAASPSNPAAQSAISDEEQQRVLLEAEEIASVRGMFPVEALPDELPAAAPSGTRVAGTQTCFSCGKLNPAGDRFCEGCGRPLQAALARVGTHVQTAPDSPVTSQLPPAPAPSAPAYNAWLDTGPVATPRLAARAKAGSAPPTAAAAAQAATQPAAKDDSFFYFYDDAKAPRQNRKLLVILLLVFAVGIAGLIYLMSRSPKKSAPAGNITVAISPASANVSPGEGFDFAATVTGSGDTDVTWSVEEGNSGGKVINRGAQAQGGKVAVIGVYVAPQSPGTYHLVATSKADATKSATAEVLVSGK